MKILDKEFDVFIPAKEIDSIVCRLANEVNRDFEDKNPYFLVMMNGAFMFASDFLRKITIRNNLSFIKYKSYNGLQSTGKVVTEMMIPSDVKDRDVVIIEDIVDTGLTMQAFLNDLKQLNPKSVSIVSFLLKPESLKCKFPVKYLGREIENKFVVGYGLDYDGEGRGLGDLFILKEN